MLSREENDLLTRVGPGTPMGNLMRQYWQPALLSAELPQRDGPPIRVRLLGEDLVAFRDSRGRVGLLGALCPHRGAPLFLGRNEESGLRCIYHGWKFDTGGRCLEMPNVPVGGDYKDKVGAVAYRSVERNGVIWAYMGPLAEPPVLPELEWSELPAEHRLVTKQLLECNYAQALEGDLDPSHISFLHAPLDPQGRNDYQGSAGIPLSDRNLGDAALEPAVKAKDKHPLIIVIKTDYGLLVGARREAGADRYYWRLTQLVLPFYVFVPGAVDSPLHCNAWVPLDDEHTIVWRIQYLAGRPFTDGELDRLQTGLGAHVPRDGYLPATTTPAGAWIPRVGRSNDYLQDRQVQRTVSFSGIRGIWAQDRACTEGMGPILDRTKEHLGPSDVTVIQTRRRLLTAATALEKHGMPPPGLGVTPPIVQSPTVFLPKSVTWEAISQPYARGKATTTAPG
jgi:nitrite reductase/ring-hydroxylating ferredoxin subunit